MGRLSFEKCLVTAVLTACCLWMPVTGYTKGDGCVWNHLLYMLSHANVWHLAGNLFVLWIMTRRLYLLPSVAIAFAASFLPSFGIWPIGMTVGFSGVLFAIVGIKWGVYCRSFVPAGRLFYRLAIEEFFVKVLPFAIIPVLIPHVNWCLHLYCLLAGFAYGRYTVKTGR